MWAFWGHLTLQKCIPICLAFLRKILFRNFFTQRIIPQPFLLVLSRRWMSYSLKLSSEFRISLWSQVSTSNTKSRPITVSGARLCKYYVNTCLLMANKLLFLTKTHLKHWRYDESTMLRRPFTVWIDLSIFRMEDNKVLSIEKNRKTSIFNWYFLIVFQFYSYFFIEGINMLKLIC